MGAAAALLLALEIVVAVSALVGGALLAARPDGSWLDADPAALDGTPFRDWRWPGVLLFVLVGCTFAALAVSDVRGVPGAVEAAIAAGMGLIAFELVELAWLGPHVLQALVSAMGVLIVALATRLTRRRRP